MPGSRSSPRRAARLLAGAVALMLAGCPGGPPPWAGRNAGLQATGRYVPVPGDTVSEIAERLGVPAADIIAANRLRPPYTIYVGKALVIPERRAVARTPAANPSRRVAAASAPPPAPAPAEPPPPSAAEAAEERRTAAASARASREPPPRSAAGFVWPVEGEVLSRFGDELDGRPNEGISIAAPLGAPVRAIDNGVVVYADDELPGYGNLLLIRHADGFLSAYAHNQGLTVALGDRVERGQVVARVGRTGAVDRPQLHLRLRRGQEALDPLAWLPPRPGVTTRA